MLAATGRMLSAAEKQINERMLTKGKCTFTTRESMSVISVGKSKLKTGVVALRLE